MNDVDRAVHYLPELRSLTPFIALSDAPARYLAGGSQVRTAGRGQIVCEKGSLSSGVQCVLSGRIKLSAISALGTERVLDILMPGRVFGLAAVLLDEPCPVFAESLNECRILVIGRERLQSAIGEWPELASVILELMARDVTRLLGDLEACCLMSARQRLADFLIKQSRCQTEDAHDETVVVLPASKALIASRLNVSPETFSRELHELAALGLVTIDRRSIRITSLAALSQYLHNENVANPLERVVTLPPRGALPRAGRDQ
jgi:CRP-like cAMP-binding protein